MANPEIAKEQFDRLPLQAQAEQHDGFWQKVAREAYVMGGGLVGGAVSEGWKEVNDQPKETAIKLAASVGIGVVLGAAQRRAGIWGLGAEAIGSALGISFMADLSSPERLGLVQKTWLDTWSSAANQDGNRTLMDRALGQFAFDSGLMTIGGLSGATAGQLGANRLTLGFLKPEAFRGARAGAEVSSQWAWQVHELFGGNGRLGQLNADVAKVEDPFVKADGILKDGKKKSYNAGDFNNLGEAIAQMQKDKLVERDDIAQTRKEEIEGLTRQGAVHQAQIGKLKQEVAQLEAQKAAVDALTREKSNLKSAESQLAMLEQAAESLPGKREELKAVNKLMQDQAEVRKAAAKHQGDDGGAQAKREQGDQQDAAKDALKTRRNELQAEIEQIVKDTGEANLRQARERVETARRQLAEAETSKPDKLGQLAADIEAKKSEIGQRATAYKTAGEQLRQAIDSYEGRVKDLVTNAALLVERPQQPVREVKTSKPEAKTADAAADRNSANKAPDTAKPGVNPFGGSTGKEAVAPLAKDGSTATDKVESKTGVGGVARAGRNQEAAAEKAIDARAPEVVARRKADTALQLAKDAVADRQRKEQAIDEAREVKSEAGRELAAIKSGKRQFADDAARQAALEEAAGKQAKAAADMAKIGNAPYHKPLKLVNEYAKASGDYLAVEKDAQARESFAKTAVQNLETMLSGIKDSRRALDGGPDLPSAAQANGMWAEARLSQIHEHLDRKLKVINDRHTAEVQETAKQVEGQPTVQSAVGKVASGELKGMIPGVIRDDLAGSMPAQMSPEVRAARLSKIGALSADQANIDLVHDNSTILFFENGKLVQNRNRTTGQLGAQFLDVNQYLSGHGRLERFAGHTPEGYVILAPRVRVNREGKLELVVVGNKSDGRPILAKEVVMAVGTVPEGISKGTSFGRIYNNFRGEPAKPAAVTADAGARRSRPNYREFAASPAVELELPAAVQAPVTADINGADTAGEAGLHDAETTPESGT